MIATHLLSCRLANEMSSVLMMMLWSSKCRTTHCGCERPADSCSRGRADIMNDAVAADTSAATTTTNTKAPMTTREGKGAPSMA